MVQSPMSDTVHDAKTTPEEDTVHRVRTLYGVPFGQMAFELIDRAYAAQRANGGLALHICADDTAMAELGELIRYFGVGIEYLEFPAWDCLPYDRVSPASALMGRRMAVLAQLLARQNSDIRKPLIVLTTVNAFTQRVPPRSAMAGSNFSLRKGGRVKPDDLIAFLSGNGYERTDTVREAGEFAVRGGIIDLFAPDGDPDAAAGDDARAVRVDFFGDEIDSLRLFDPVTQRSEGHVPHLTLSQASELILTEERIQHFRAAYRDHFGAVVDKDPLYEAVSEGRRYAGVEHWLPLFYADPLETVLDYADGAMLSYDHHGPQTQAERVAHIEDFYASRKAIQASHSALKKKNKTTKGARQSLRDAETKAEGQDVSLTGALYNPLPPDLLYLNEDEIARLIAEAVSAVQFSPFAAPTDRDEDRTARAGRDFKDIRALPDGDVFGALRDHIRALQQTQKGHETRRVVIASYSEGARERIKGLMEHADLTGLRLCDNAEHIHALKKGQVGLAVLPLERGFVNERIAVLSEQDILGDRLVRKTKNRKSKSDVFIREVSSLNEGDLVVHQDHGIGRFMGLETLNIAGAFHDCLKIVYGGDDKLFIPVENIEILSRFGADEGTVALDRLGGAGWQARKARVKKNLMEMAGKLMDIAAARKLRKAEKLSIPDTVYQEFAARFPYHETDDQAKSIEDVLADLASELPMDRLVCGDVGFGKTEIALRAAFVAAMAGVQVAVVVPTTLLARQHYAGFMERFRGFGLRIEQLSRLVNAKQSKLVKEGLAKGDVNIVIGTHALLANAIKFNHLGLVVVDEEQRFGVKQKERLKDLKKDVHILTLTATPIPRTLQMALTGVRDLSLITTPPVDRLAIRNFVMPFDPMVIREAVLREHYRGGQSFCVCPRIKDLTKVEAKLKELIPEIRIVSAHGQMPPQELEERMSAFYDRQYDLLLATNIIESGIDVPSANTLIVYRADLFGLSQLYQIRGRVGRSKQRAYAYLTYLPDMVLTQDAQKRLEVIDMIDTLGGGFQIASHDLDIRGAGNLVGEQQSGHIREVGVELYQQMLEEAVAAARDGAANDDTVRVESWTPEIQLGTSVLIPERYVKDLNVRLSLYRRVADLADQTDIESFAAEMIDRFGHLPKEVENLLEVITIKQLCRKAGVSKIDAGPKGIVVAFHNDRPPNPEKVLRLVAQSVGTIKLRQDQKLAYTRSWGSDALRVAGVRKILSDLVAAAAA